MRANRPRSPSTARVRQTPTQSSLARTPAVGRSCLFLGFGSCPFIALGRRRWLFPRSRSTRFAPFFGKPNHVFDRQLIQPRMVFFGVIAFLGQVQLNEARVVCTAEGADQRVKANFTYLLLRSLHVI